jgi:arylsulfatase
LDLERFRSRRLSGLGAGKHTIVLISNTTVLGLGKGGTGLLTVDDKEVLQDGRVHHTSTKRGGTG